MIEAREDGDVDAFEQYYEEALEINSERVEAYVERADLLFELQEYSEDIVYIEKHVLTTDGLEFSSDIGYVYYMLGLCYFETETVTLGSVFHIESLDNGIDSLSKILGFLLTYTLVFEFEIPVIAGFLQIRISGKIIEV